MKDEIKEILDWLSDDDIYVEDYGYQYKRISLRESKLLLDYITNLQEENERLSVELNKNMVERNNYLSRNEKAIKYINIIKENTPSSTRKDFAKMIVIDYKNLLNILNGGDDNE